MLRQTGTRKGSRLQSKAIHPVDVDGILGSRSSRLTIFFFYQGPVEGFPRHCPSPSHASSDERIGAAIGQRQRLLGQSEDLPCRITRGDSPSRRPSIWQPLQNRRWGFPLCISTCVSTATRRWLCPGSATAPTRNPMRGQCAVLASSPSWASSASPRTKSYRRPIVLS